jgi:hypothetical protein
MVRGFAPCGDDTMFDQVGVGGGREDFHVCLVWFSRMAFSQFYNQIT